MFFYGSQRMKVGNWDIHIGFLYYRLPEDWDDLDEAFKRSRPSWNDFGIHLWHESTDEGYMLEVKLSRRYGARTSYRHLPAYWVAMACDCNDCRLLRRKLKIKRKGNKRA